MKYREELDEVGDSSYEDWRQAQDDEREQMLEDALNAALKAGVDREHLKTLAREAGATHWALVNSLRETQKKSQA